MKNGLAKVNFLSGVLLGAISEKIPDRIFL
nr:MAG TPA: hypothetical protein [Caudoviricetes sp.]